MAKEVAGTRARMTRLVASFRQSGQTRAEFARSCGITVFKLDYWTRRMPVSKPDARRSNVAGFVPVRLRIEDAVESSAIEIVLAGGERVRLGHGVGGERLREVLAALR